MKTVFRDVKKTSIYYSAARNKQLFASLSEEIHRRCDFSDPLCSISLAVRSLASSCLL